MDLPYLAHLGSAAGTELASLEVAMQTLLHSGLGLHFHGHHSLPAPVLGPCLFPKGIFWCQPLLYTPVWGDVADSGEAAFIPC